MDNDLSSSVNPEQDRLMGVPSVEPVWVESAETNPEEGHANDENEHHNVEEPRLRDMPRTVWNLPRILLLGLIRLYQATFSRALPPDSCRFYPSCSHYGYQAIYKYGVIKGSLMAAWRVMRCNPFNKGGFDPVP